MSKEKILARTQKRGKIFDIIYIFMSSLKINQIYTKMRF